ncbi:MAG: DUF11 domain-containing protein [Bifidobacteriaceae bacterium]|jgi:LPXTG-motif cell wall-anchored protein|nr:DUF11 domain-containing protein [Bifidobacteriaceae bacterium]
MAALAAVALALAGLVSGVAGGEPAEAASDGYVGMAGWGSSGGGDAHDVFYVYVRNSSEVVQLAVSELEWSYATWGGTPEVRLELYRPSGGLAGSTVVSGHGVSGSVSASGEAGVWKAQVVGLNTPPSQSWVYRQQLRVLAGGAHVPGRVWAKGFGGAQTRPAALSVDFEVYVVADDGAVFETAVRGYDGINSGFVADGLGLYLKDGCVPLRRSRLLDPPAAQLGLTGGGVFTPVPECDRQFNLFFDPPAADLPERADYWGHSGQEGFVKPVYRVPDKPQPKLAVDHAAPAGAPYQGASGTLGIAGFRGEYQVMVDVNGNGSYADPGDVVETGQKPLAAGDVSWSWDGKDAGGNAVVADYVGVAVQLLKGDEYYQTFSDAERLAGGVQVRQLAGYAVARNGGAPVWPLVHWDDSEVLSTGLRLGTNPVASLRAGSADVKTPAAGVSTQGFKHAWVCYDPSYPNSDPPWPDWTWLQDSCWGNNATVQFGVWNDLSKDVALRSDPVGLYRRAAQMVSKTGALNPPAGNPLARTIAYTVKVKNTSNAAGLAAERQERLGFGVSDPLTVTDVLPAHTSGWAYASTAYDKGSSPSQASASAAGGKMTWRGPLKAGETATITYKLTVEPGFEASRTNQASITGCPAGAADVNTYCGKTPVSNTVPLPGLSIEKTVETTGLHAKGHTASYTVTVANVGKAGFTASDPAVAYDDLSGVLDDAAFDPATLKATAGTAAWEPAAKRIAWSGPLGVGASAKITYTVAYDPHVSGEASDLLLENTAWIRPVDVIDQTPGERVSTQTPGSDLHVAKSVDAEVARPGQVATFTVDLWNTRGRAGAPVNLVDHLAGVLDDADLVSGSVKSTDPAIAVGFDPAARVLSIAGTLKAGASAKVTYQVKVKAQGRADSVLVNRIGPGSGECRADDPLCTSTPVTSYTVAKTSNTDSGLPPHAGEPIRYTVTFTNTGAVPARIAEHDHLEWVLDDADVTGLASDYAPVKAVMEGQAVAISGVLEVGAAARVTYQATVRDREHRGDQVLTNVVYPDQVCGADPNSPCPRTVIPTARPTCGAELGRPCTTNLVRDLAVAKTADPPLAKPFQTVDYNVKLASVGSAPVAVDLVDLTRWLADDATMVKAPASDNAHVTAAYDRLALTAAITGQLAAGEEANVSYQVKVKPFQGRGDHRLVNVIAPRDPAAPGRPDIPEDDIPNCARLAAGTCTDTPVGEYGVVKTADKQVAKPGEVVTYTLAFTNRGAAPATVDVLDSLRWVLDDATLAGPPVSDTPGLTAVFDRTAQSIKVAGTIPAPVGTAARIVYQVLVNQSADRADHRLENFVTPAGPGPSAKPRCTDGDPACAVTLVEDFQVVKTADRDMAKPGEAVTYALTFTNRGAAPATVNVMDHLAGVLDDADLAGEPASDAEGLTAQFDPAGQTIAVAGTIPSPVGTAAVITYQVIVKPFADRGDSLLANFVIADPGQTVPDECADGDPLCTVTPVEELTVGKSVDVASLRPGEVANFNVTFANRGQTSVELNHHDLLGWVLDDGELQGLPTADNQAVAAAWAPQAQRLEITGALGPGETATVSYGAKATRAGDWWFHNYVVAAAEPYDSAPFDPRQAGAAPACDPAEGMICTVTPIHPLPQPPPALPVTGTQSAGFAALIALGLILGGVALLAWRSRKAARVP